MTTDSATVELVTFADIEALLVAHLHTELTARGEQVTVATRVPNPRPNRLVRITRIGGTRANLIADAPMATVECWDTTSTAASDLCGLVRSLIWGMEGATVNGVWVYRVREVGGPSSFPDPATDLPRYQLTVLIRTRGKAL